ncbi:hypothetical protein PGQ11_002830 [Apiospora arundinis]|uniref:Uncharacterized protein n=1 Tax=Apiospora arundinis TaxID=335852 RepID=A0ABR2J3F4_9PEZI
MSICEPVYAHTNASTIMNAIRTVNSKALKWVNKYNGENEPVTPPNAWLEKSSLVYSDYTLLLAYMNIAVLDRGVPLRSPLPSSCGLPISGSPTVDSFCPFDPLLPCPSLTSPVLLLGLFKPSSHLRKRRHPIAKLLARWANRAKARIYWAPCSALSGLCQQDPKWYDLPIKSA